MTTKKSWQDPDQNPTVSIGVGFVDDNPYSKDRQYRMHVWHEWMTPHNNFDQSLQWLYVDKALMPDALNPDEGATFPFRSASSLPKEGELWDIVEGTSKIKLIKVSAELERGKLTPYANGQQKPEAQRFPNEYYWGVKKILKASIPDNDADDADDADDDTGFKVDNSPLDTATPDEKMQRVFNDQFQLGTSIGNALNCASTIMTPIAEGIYRDIASELGDADLTGSTYTDMLHRRLMEEMIPSLAEQTTDLSRRILKQSLKNITNPSAYLLDED